MQKWEEIARKDMADGVAEVPGKASHPRIVEYNKYVKYGTANDDEAWCAKFLNACFEEAGIKGTNSPAARSFLNWGVPLHEPIPGCVVVYWRDKPEGWTGHVHLYVREDEKHIYGIGGNQGNKVCEAPYPKDRVLAFRWPAGVAIPEPDAEQVISVAIVDAMALRDEFARVGNLMLGWSKELSAAIEGVA